MCFKAAAAAAAANAATTVVVAEVEAAEAAERPGEPLLAGMSVDLASSSPRTALRTFSATSRALRMATA